MSNFPFRDIISPSKSHYFVRHKQRSKLFVLQKKEETSLFNLWMILFAAPRVILLQVVVRAFAASTLSALLHPI